MAHHKDKYALKKFKKSNLSFVFKAAFIGLLHSLSTQRNMKIHWISGFMVMLVGMTIPFDFAAKAALFFSVFLILFAELMNSAFEAIVDLCVSEYNQYAKIAKDAAAAAVLLLSCAVAILFFNMIFVEYWSFIFKNTHKILITLINGLPCVAVIVWYLFFPQKASAFKLPVWFIVMGFFVYIAKTSPDHGFSITGALFLFVALVSSRYQRDRLIS